MITFTLNQFGLREKDMKYMLRLFLEIPAIEKVMIYGSRATGDFERGSDVDLAVFGRNVTHQHIVHLHMMLEEESPTLLWFDVLHYDTLKNEKLKRSIEAEGVCIFMKEK